MIPILADGGAARSYILDITAMRTRQFLRTTDRCQGHLMPTTTPEPQPRVANVRLRGETGRLAARAHWPGPGVRAPPALVVYLHAADAGTTPARLCEQAGVVVLAVRLDSDLPPRDGMAAVRWAADHAG